jgi:hypothetical protein
VSTRITCCREIQVGTSLPDWTALIWGVPLAGVVGSGTYTGSNIGAYVSATSTGSPSESDFASLGNYQNQGQIGYDGPGGTSYVNLTAFALHGGPPAGYAASFIIVRQVAPVWTNLITIGGTELGWAPFPPTPTGNYPFIVPLMVGGIIQVYFGVTAGGNDPMTQGVCNASISANLHN